MSLKPKKHSDLKKIKEKMNVKKSKMDVGRQEKIKGKKESVL